MLCRRCSGAVTAQTYRHPRRTAPSRASRQAAPVPKMSGQMLRATPVGVALNSVNVRRRPTLPRSPDRSTIGAVGLNFQVRNGDWVFPRRYGHRNSIEISTNHPAKPQTLRRRMPGLGFGCWGLTVFREPYSGREDFSQLRSAVSLGACLPTEGGCV